MAEVQVRVGADTIRVEDSSGDGRPLVLLHPGITDSRVWDPLLPLLGGHRVIRHDRRGFGSFCGCDRGVPQSRRPRVRARPPGSRPCSPGRQQHGWRGVARARRDGSAPGLLDAQLEETTRADLAQEELEQANPEQWELLDALQMPTTIIAAELDPPESLQASLDLADRIPGAALVRLETDHLPPVQPTRVRRSRRTRHPGAGGLTRWLEQWA